MNDEEARARMRYLELKAKAAAAAPAPAPAPAPEEPGFFNRAANTVVTGVSDALSTAAGDTYGRNGDPTQRDNLDPRSRLVKAVGGDLLSAAGQVVGDAVIETGKILLPKAAEDAIASGVQAISETAPIKAVGRGLAKWKAKSPESYAAAGEAANIGAALLPIKGLKPTAGAKATTRLTNTLARNRAKEIKQMLTPADLEGGKLSIADDLLESQVFTPGPRLQGVLDEVDTVPGVNPRKSYTHNMNAIEDQVTALRQSLDDKLVGASPIPVTDVDSAVAGAVARTGQSHTLVGDAATSAQRIYDKFNSLVAAKAQNGGITPQALLDTRRELDAWLRNSPGDVFGPGATASRIATRDIRDTLNSLVDTAVPNAGVKADLGRMHKLLLATEDLLPKAKAEGGNRLTRYMETLERTTGMKHPVNPQSAVITARNPVVAAGVGVSAVALGLKRGLGESILKYHARLQTLLDDAVARGAPAAEKALIIDAMNKDKAHAPRR